MLKLGFTCCWAKENPFLSSLFVSLLVVERNWAKENPFLSSLFVSLLVVERKKILSYLLCLFPKKMNYTIVWSVRKKGNPTSQLLLCALDHRHYILIFVFDAFSSSVCTMIWNGSTSGSHSDNFFSLLKLFYCFSSLWTIWWWSGSHTRIKNLFDRSGFLFPKTWVEIILFEIILSYIV